MRTTTNRYGIMLVMLTVLSGLTFADDGLAAGATAEAREDAADNTAETSEASSGEASDAPGGDPEGVITGDRHDEGAENDEGNEE